MKRAIGTLIVLGLIGGAMWIGAASSKQEVVLGIQPIPEGAIDGDDLECPPDEMRGDTEANSFLDPSASASSEQAVRAALPGLLAKDRLVTKGNQILIVREGYRIAVATLVDGDEGWIVAEIENCVSANIFGE